MRRRVIVIPTYLIPQLTDQEFDAVVAHELEHLRFHDPLFKQLGSLICSLFWWIPTNWWLNRIHQEQERACDASIANYGLHPHALATALCNVIRESKQGPDLVTLCQFTSRKSDTMARLRAMLDRPATRGFRRGRFALASLVTGAMISSIWIC
jgi:bla regulator protein blaR1